MKPSQIIAVSIALIACLWIGSSLLVPPASHEETIEQAMEEGDDALLQVRVRKVELEDYTDTVLITGRTRGSQSVDLASEVSAQLVAVLAEEGAIVEKGAPLARLEIKDRQARLTEARERYEQRKIEYNAAKNLANKGFNSKVRLAQSRADLEEAKALLETAKVDLSNTEITAPFEGIVDRRAIDVGAFVNTGDMLFRLVDLDPIELIGYVSEHEVDDIALGKPAKATLLNGETIEGEVSFIASEANENTRTFRVEISAPNPEYQIKAGLTAELELQARQKTVHKISPSSLALNDKGEVGVMVLEDNDITRFAKVTIVADHPDYMYIDGLPEGPVRLITVGQHYVTEGQEVKPVYSDKEGVL